MEFDEMQVTMNFVFAVVGDSRCCVAGKRCRPARFAASSRRRSARKRRAADAVVLAKLVKEAPPASERGRSELGHGDVRDRRSAARPGVARRRRKKSASCSSAIPIASKTYLVTGLGKDKIDWTTPLPLSPAAVEYVRKLPTRRRRRAPTGWRSFRSIWSTKIRSWRRMPTTNSPGRRTRMCRT